MANKAIKYRIYPTTEQSIMFSKTFGCCRKVYNLMLSDKIEYYKETKGGCNAMCKMMEDMRKEAAEAAAKEAAMEKATETAMNMLKDNISPEKVALYCGLSLEEVEKIKEENNL